MFLRLLWVTISGISGITAVEGDICTESPYFPPVLIWPGLCL